MTLFLKFQEFLNGKCFLRQKKLNQKISALIEILNVNSVDLQKENEEIDVMQLGIDSEEEKINVINLNLIEATLLISANYEDKANKELKAFEITLFNDPQTEQELIPIYIQSKKQQIYV